MVTITFDEDNNQYLIQDNISGTIKEFDDFGKFIRNIDSNVQDNKPKSESEESINIICISTFDKKYHWMWTEESGQQRIDSYRKVLSKLLATDFLYLPFKFSTRIDTSIIESYVFCYSKGITEKIIENLLEI